MRFVVLSVFSKLEFQGVFALGNISIYVWMNEWMDNLFLRRIYEWMNDLNFKDL